MLRPPLRPSGLTPPTTPRCLITLCFYNKIRELVPALHQHLMRYLRRNSHHIPRPEFLPNSALDRAVALFMRRSRFAVEIRSANQERRAAFHATRSDHPLLCALPGSLRLESQRAASSRNDEHPSPPGRSGSPPRASAMNWSSVRILPEQ